MRFIHTIGMYGSHDAGVAEHLDFASNASRPHRADSGAPTVRYRVDKISGTLGTAYGCVGGYIAGSSQLVDVSLLAGAKTSIEYQAAHNTDRRLQQLHTRATRAALIAKDIPMITNPSHIIPLLVGDAEAAKKGEEKLRITPTLGRGREFTDDLVTAVDAVWTELGIKRTSDWVAARPDGFLGVGQADQPHNKPLWTDEQFGLNKHMRKSAARHLELLA
ncbi:hypothetical protein LY78DRAFT_743252 [Colletotrichum sublineola]|nr:hypothetical protein LY78DRAFT_743252 [Colletotrichum sublineola]